MEEADGARMEESVHQYIAIDRVPSILDFIQRCLHIQELKEEVTLVESFNILFTVLNSLSY